eukprot:2012006-Alexandrium_andersonii.AAC.1
MLRATATAGTLAAANVDPWLHRGLHHLRRVVSLQELACPCKAEQETRLGALISCPPVPGRFTRREYRGRAA